MCYDHQDSYSTRLYKALQGSGWLYKAGQGSTRLYKAVQGSTCVYKALQDSLGRALKDLEGAARPCTGLVPTESQISLKKGPETPNIGGIAPINISD